MDEKSLLRQKKSDTDQVLPPVADLLKDEQDRSFTYTDLDGASVKLDLMDFAQQDPYPLPMPIDREGYCSQEMTHRFWATGLSDWRNIIEAQKRFLTPAGGDAKIRLLDFGCASGRVLRHTMTVPSEDVETCAGVEPWGCDFAPANIEWMKRHLPKRLRSFVNTAVPHLPFEDNYFDVVTAFSVFTHIGQLEEAWLLELRRITRPGGILYLTVQNDDAWGRVLKRPTALNRLKKANQFENELTVDKTLFSSPMPKQRIVFLMPGVENYSYNVWHSNEYIKDSWGQYFDVLDIAANAHVNYQSVAILRSR